MRVSRLCLVLIAAPGCGFTPGSLGSGIDASDTMRSDVRIDNPPGQLCVGGGLYTECFPPGSEPIGMFAVPAQQIDTDNDASCDIVVPQASQPSLCVKHAANIMIDVDATFTGQRPYVLLATDSITMTDTASLDFSANIAMAGAGCNASPGGQDLGGGASAGAGGGGGGGFGGGGAGGSAGQGSGAGGGGGGGLGLTVIRGGCPGAKGGNSSDGSGGAGGRPGGALYLIAGGSITIAGDLFANGGGGLGGANKAGGGGGGSGGFVGFDAPTVTLNATAEVVANGGAGGEGGGAGQPGNKGQDATGWDVRPDGGVGNSNGSNGGNGAYARTTAPTSGATGGDGGGGGGGGFGHIRVYATTLTLSDQMSPAAAITTIP